MSDTKKNLRSYIWGFMLSVAFTLAAYFLLVGHEASRHQMFSHSFLRVGVMLLAFVQFLVQLVFFLHLGKESKPRWNLVVFLSTVSIVFIVVVGSLWIMDHLNYNMTPADMNTYLLHDEAMQR